MAITDDSHNGFYMPVAPAYGGGYGNNGGFFGGDWAWILLLLLIGGNGWGFGGFGGGGAMPWLMGGAANAGLDYLYPWLNNSQQLTGGFRDQQINSQLGDIQTALCTGFGGVNQTVQNGFAQAEIAANGRQTANLQQQFALQSQLAQCCCDNRLATSQTQNIIQAEAAANRASGTADTQRILDKLCQLEQDGLKARLDAKDDTIDQLRSELLYARGQASQIDQTSRILAGQAAEIDGVYNRLKNCPVGTVPVYGNQPIFQCPQTAYGCGCGAT